LCNAYEQSAHKPWTQPLGYEYAAYEVAADALKRAADLDRETLRQSIAATDLKTIVGPIRFDKQNICHTPVVGGQWHKNKKWPWDLTIVYNRQHPNIPLRGKMVAIA
jgi:branched-chain amino acid transport system substrate-binding protein